MKTEFEEEFGICEICGEPIYEEDESIRGCACRDEDEDD